MLKLHKPHHFCLCKALLSNYFNHIAQFLLTQVCKFYCFHSRPYIFVKYASHNHLCCPMFERSVSRNVASLNILVCDVINPLYTNWLPLNDSSAVSIFYMSFSFIILNPSTTLCCPTLLRTYSLICVWSNLSTLICF